MIHDARDETVRLNRSVQVAIVGAGPAGLVLAGQLAQVADVLLIEGGGFEDESESRALLWGECVGLPYPLCETRARGFGGSSALWAGYCAPFDPLDFQRRDWVWGSGWPFGLEELAPYYERAAPLLNLGEFHFDARDIARRAGISLPFDDETVVPSVWRFGAPTRRFGTDLRREFEACTNPSTLLHANLVDIRLDRAKTRVQELVIRTVDGRQGYVSADLVVLACGGIETPRILLNTDSQVPDGLGNGSDMVGRCFMEHPHIAIDSLILERPGAFESWTRRGTYCEGREFLPSVGLSADTQRELKILNSRAHVYRTPGMAPFAPPKVGVFLEQAPNPGSRVTLSEARDSLGLRRARLDWQLTELDWRTFERTAAIVSSEFERVGAGGISGSPQRVRPEVVLHSNHQLGTTRMSRDGGSGVVDPNCRVHEVSNLYIAGGSVFPTVSWANPTLTVLALVLRLADHLCRALRNQGR
jgi:choline dehydrogenase-like flavoprotein